ncbi:conserved hypothetical protein [Candidatus Nitrotoga sp. HW29]|nr:conserved hypothetical protein [Candidatus Nitrotoga sp. HW29]
MGKDRLHRRDLMREQLAHQAARLMAEGGITDYAFAKRKAAKQLGAEDTQHLPSNDEVEMALRSFRALYQSESHPLVLHKLRQQALATMQLLEPFHPFLTGSVLKGTAGEQSDINLLVYSDDEKAMMMFLLKHNLSFEGGEWSIHLTGRQQTVPSFMLKTETGVPVNIAVLPENARHSGSRKIGKQADMATVKRLLSESVNTE